MWCEIRGSTLYKHVVYVTCIKLTLRFKCVHCNNNKHLSSQVILIMCKMIRLVVAKWADKATRLNDRFNFVDCNWQRVAGVANFREARTARALIACAACCMCCAAHNEWVILKIRSCWQINSNDNTCKLCPEGDKKKWEKPAACMCLCAICVCVY